jgi:hypothetical protein
VRGREQDRSAAVVVAGCAFVQNLRRGDCDLSAGEAADRRVVVAFDELAMVI